jgi:hypothetical protein
MGSSTPAANPTWLCRAGHSAGQVVTARIPQAGVLTVYGMLNNRTTMPNRSGQYERQEDQQSRLYLTWMCTQLNPKRAQHDVSSIASMHSP